MVERSWEQADGGTAKGGIWDMLIAAQRWW